MHDTNGLEQDTEAKIQAYTVHILRQFAQFLKDHYNLRFLGYHLKRYALCYRSLSRVSVCDVGVLWPNGWMNQDATW